MRTLVVISCLAVATSFALAQGVNQAARKATAKLPAAAKPAPPAAPAAAKPAPPPAPPAPAAPKGPAPYTEADLKQLAADLVPLAEAWAVDELDLGDPNMRAVDTRIRSAVYDENTVKAFKGAIAGIRVKGPQKIYIINRLISPLLSAKTEVIREAVPLFKSLRTDSTMRYQMFKTVPDNRAESLWGQPKFPKNIAPEAHLKALERLDERRQEKVAAEMPIALNNLAVSQLDKTCMACLVLADDPREDEKLVQVMLDYEKRGNFAFFYVVQAFTAQANKMSPERAGKLMDGTLGKFAEAMRYEHKSYLDPAKPFVNPTGNSSFASNDLYVGVTVLPLINLLATTAKKPAVKVPTDDDVEDYKKAHPKTPVRKP